MDGVLDEMAAEVGMDPLAFRKLNDEHETRLAEYDIAAEEIGWDRRKPDGQSPGTLKRGFGIGANTWGNRPGGGIKIDLRIYPDGKLEVRSGIQDIGTGSRTILVDLVAYKMGLSRDFIIGSCGRTDLPNGPGSGGSTVSRSIAPSVFHAADAASAAMLELAAKELDTSADKLAVKGDAIVDKADGSQKMTWLQACKLIPSDHLEVSGKAERGDAFYGEGDSEGVVMCEAEVDTETGVVKIIKLVNVQACGKPINRKTVESQIVGCTIAGIGFALFEERILDAENGAQVNPNMEAYKLPGPADMPEIVPIIYAPEHFTGVRALGEPAHVGITGAIGNAVANAIGARVYSMPITPAKVLAALNG